MYITTPIYYVNARPHIGHAYTTIVADVLARHYRLKGEDVFLLTGVDEHGEPVSRAADKLGISEQELVDENAKHFTALSEAIGASPDFFIRTSDARHKVRVQQLLTKLYDKGLVYKDQYEGLYCGGCADFKRERDLVDGECPLHPGPITVENESNWFFKLSAFKDDLKALNETEWLQPKSYRKEVLGLIEGLEDVSLSRASATWGVDVPWDDGQVFYVWFDALLNYLTAPDIAGRDEWPADIQIIGKDILKFHAVLWPALLWALELPLPKALHVHGYLLNRGRKISKSLGNTIDPFSIADDYGKDAVRLALTRDVVYGADGNLDDTDTFARAQQGLADVYGNLVRRVWTLAEKNFSALPPGDIHPLVWQTVEDVPVRVQDAFDAGDVTAAVGCIWDCLKDLNGVVDALAPWKIEDEEELAVVLGSLVEAIACVSVLLSVVCVEGPSKVLDVLSIDASYEQATLSGTTRPWHLPTLEVLYPRRPV